MMWMRPCDISSELGIPKDTLYSWYKLQKDAWFYEREAAAQKVVEKIKDNHVGKFHTIAKHIIEIILREVEQMHLSEQGLNIRDLEKVANILGNIDKIQRLEAGKPTDIKKQVKVTHSDLMKSLQKLKEVDPYADYEVVEDEPVH